MKHVVLGKFGSVLQFKRALRFVWQSSPAWTAVNCIAVLLQGLAPLLSLYLFKVLIDAITLDIRVHGTGDAGRKVLTLLIYTAAISLFVSVLRAVISLSNGYSSQEVSDKMQDSLHKQSSAVDLQYYENASFYDTLHRAQVEAPYRSSKIVANMTQLILSAITLIAIGVFVIATIRWKLVLLLLLITLPGIVFKFIFAGRLYKWQRASTSIERLSNYYSWLLTSESSAKEIRLFGLGSFFADRSAGLRDKLRVGKLSITKGRSLADGASDVASTAAIYFVFAVMSMAAIAGRTTIGTVVVFFQAIQRGQSALQDLLSGIADFYENNLFLTNLHEFLELRPHITDPLEPVAFPQPIRGGITFSHVSFTYAGSDRPVLDDVSFKIAAGETIALVGENGAGKTTLIKLLTRLYDPDNGVIAVDGIAINRFRVEDLRQKIAVVFQDYLRYAMTLRENIWLGNTESSAEGGEVESAAEKSGAAVFAHDLPNGFDTPLTHLLDGGVELSTGQWQKIAIARAFFRHSDILLLDEPTSSLDAQSEYEVFRSFRQLVEGRTAIIVSHRLSTVRMADRIIVLDSGRIVEEGTHDELVSLGGAYARVFETQVNSYSGKYT